MNLHKMHGHLSHIQQGSEIDVLISSSKFYHLIVSVKEVFPENFSFLVQFSLTLQLLKVLGVAKNFHFGNFFDFQGLLTIFSDSFCCQSYWSYFLNLDQKQFQKYLEQKFESHFICHNHNFSLQKTCKKWSNWPILMSINQQQSTRDIYVFQH